jgi:hypothetical protein
VLRDPGGGLADSRGEFADRELPLEQRPQQPHPSVVGQQPKDLRVLRRDGRFAVSDVIADPGMDQETRHDMQQWTGCVAGALTRA